MFGALASWLDTSWLLSVIVGYALAVLAMSVVTACAEFWKARIRPRCLCCTNVRATLYDPEHDDQSRPHLCPACHSAIYAERLALDEAIRVLWESVGVRGEVQRAD